MEKSSCSLEKQTVADLTNYPNYPSLTCRERPSNPHGTIQKTNEEKNSVFRSYVYSYHHIYLCTRQRYAGDY